MKRNRWRAAAVVSLFLLIISAILRFQPVPDPPVVVEPPVETPAPPVDKLPWKPGTDERIIPPAELPAPAPPVDKLPWRPGKDQRVIPPAELPKAEPPKILGGYEITIKPGDNLWNLAKEHYGNPLLWPVIFKDNFTPSDPPDLIHSGNKLWLRAIEEE